MHAKQFTITHSHVNDYLAFCWGWKKKVLRDKLQVIWLKLYKFSPPCIYGLVHQNIVIWHELISRLGVSQEHKNRVSAVWNSYIFNALQWRHNDHDSVSNHQPRGCLLNRLFGRRSKKTSKLPVTGLCAGNSPGPVNSPHKGPVTRKMFPFDDVIMDERFLLFYSFHWSVVQYIPRIVQGLRFVMLCYNLAMISVTPTYTLTIGNVPRSTRTDDKTKQSKTNYHIDGSVQDCTIAATQKYLTYGQNTKSCSSMSSSIWVNIKL